MSQINDGKKGKNKKILKNLEKAIALEKKAKRATKKAKKIYDNLPDGISIGLNGGYIILPNRKEEKNKKKNPRRNPKRGHNG